MSKRALLLGVASMSLLTACSPQALLGAVAGPQVETAFYQGLRTELTSKKMQTAQIDCIEAELKKTIKAADILAYETAEGRKKIEDATNAATAKCITPPVTPAP